jgi:ribose/xylose/arabinose/galactoside ABC-type transport system permease subunit/ABC-type sugar transport system substrate-binding protein
MMIDTKKPRRAIRLRELSILASVVICAAIFGLLNPKFLSPDAGMVMLQGASTDALMVIGMTLVIVCGAFDLSIGSTMAASGLLSASLLKVGAPVPVAVLGGLATGVLIGCVNGLSVARLKINPFIATLAMMSVIRGLVLIATKSHTLSDFPDSFKQIAWGKVLQIPVPVIIMIGAVVVADLMMRHLVSLRRAYFVGSNEDAAALTGIDVGNVKVLAFAVTGFLAALAGVIVTARANYVDPNEGMGAELRVIAAVIVGGASLSGGRGTILGAFLGLLLMQVITTGLVFAHVPPEAQLVAVGSVLFLAAIVDRSGSTIGPNLVSFLTVTRNKKMERILVVGLAVALIAVSIFKIEGRGSKVEGTKNAARSGPKQRYVEVAIVTNIPYWIDGKAGLRDKAAELGVDYDFTGPTNVDANQQIDAMERAIAEGVDGIICVPASDALSTVIDKAIDKGIPVVCVDTDAPSSKRFSFIGTGNYNAGVQGGETLGKLLNGQGKVALLTVPGQDNLNERVRGYKAALAKYPGIAVVQEVNTMSSGTEAQSQCRALLQAQPDLAGIGCVEAAGGSGAAVAVKEAGKTGKVHIVAMDRDESTLRFIEEGQIDASVGQRSYTMSYVALQLLYNIRNQNVKLVDDWKKADINPLPPSVDTGSFVITRKNVKHFYHK